MNERKIELEKDENGHYKRDQWAWGRVDQEEDQKVGHMGMLEQVKGIRVTGDNLDEEVERFRKARTKLRRDHIAFQIRSGRVETAGCVAKCVDGPSNKWEVTSSQFRKVLELEGSGKGETLELVEDALMEGAWVASHDS